MRVTEAEILAFLLPSLLDGGAERNFINLAEQISKDGRYEVHLVVVNLNATPRHEPPAGLRVVDLNCRRVLTSGMALARYLRQARPKVVYSALDHTNSMLLLSRWLSGVKPKVVVTLRNDITHSLLPRRGIRSRLLLLMMKYVYPHSDHIVAVSRGVASAFLDTTGISADKVSVILNPVLSRQLLEKAAEKPVHPWIDSKEQPVILAVGRLTSQKNYPLLLKAMAIVQKSRDVRLIILGEGNERLALEKQLDQLGLVQRVALVGHERNPYKYMAAADTYVLSSDYEGLPTALIEALYCGAKVVSTDCNSGPREILDKGKYGILVPVGDAAALAAGIVKSLDGNYPLAARFPDENYQARDNAEKYLSLIW